MPSTHALLLLPSALALALLVAHSLVALERRRALVFWATIAAYGWVRHLAIRAITEGALDGRFPYRLQRPLLAIRDVPLQELAGWAIAVYLAWWLAERLAGEASATPSPGVVVATAALVLAATSWLVETLAGAAGWWRWTVAAGPGWLHGVPPIGLVDWSCVAADFLLPFLAWTSPSVDRGAPLAARARWATLAVWPLHFAAHAVARPPLPGWTFADLAHWLLLAGAIVVAARWRGGERTFAPETSRAIAALPWAALLTIVAVALGVELGVARDPLLLTSLVPLAGVALLTISRRAALAAGALATLLGLVHHPSWLPGAVVIAAAAVLARPPAPRARRGARTAQTAALAIGVAALAIAVQSAAAEREGELRRGLDAALASRDRGELEVALGKLLALEREFPRAPAPASFAGEILYRQGRLAEAASAFARSLHRHAHPRAARYLAVVALRRGERARAAEWAAIGLDVAPRDPELEYLAARARGEGPLRGGVQTGPLRGGVQTPLRGGVQTGPLRGGTKTALALPASADAELASRLAALAFEVGDDEGARRFLASAVARWPTARRLHEQAVRVGLASGDTDAARAAALAWRRALPDDPEPLRLLAGWAR